MDEFLKEIKAMSATDLQLIIEDQKDLYSEEEFQMILDELESRGENAIAIEEAEWDRRMEEEARKEETAEAAKIISEITYTNNLDQISPTGVVLRFAPYFAMFAAGAALFIILGIKRRKSEEE